MHRRSCLQTTSSVHYTTSCKHILVLLRMGEIIARNMLSWLKLSIKFVIVASSWLFILLYHWCTVTQTSNLIFIKSDIWEFSRKPVEKIQVSLKSGKDKGYFTWRPIYIFLIILRSALLKMRNVSNKSSRENQNTHFVFSIFFSPKIVPFMRRGKIL